MMSTIRKILFLSASPKEKARLRLDEEVRDVQEGLAQAKHRDQFTIQSQWAVRLRDLRRALLNHEPQIVHFCGHGRIEGLMVEDEDGEALLVRPNAVAGLFELFKDRMEVVLLNACYSESQAEAIAQHINYVIGMSRDISDDAAREFAVGFYDALGAGRSVEDAFKFGCNAIQLQDLPEHAIPVLKKNPALEEIPPFSQPSPTREEEEQFPSWEGSGVGSQEPPLIDPRLLKGHHFICYAADGQAFALKLYDVLAEKGVPVWLDQRDAQSGADWYAQVLEALKTCHSLLFVTTRQSVTRCAECSREWKRALAYKKPIIPLQIDEMAEIPFELEGRKLILFTGVFEDAVGQLQNRLNRLTKPAGKLELLQERLADAQRDLRQVSDPIRQVRIQADIDQLQREIVAQERISADPRTAEEYIKESIERGIERERTPEKPVSGEVRQKFINPPPGIAPTYFQNRYVETKLIADFLKDETRRLMIVAGRAGIGKTAMVCRLLKFLEDGQLPDNIGELAVGGIVYLSAVGTRRINVPHLYADLCKLLPPEAIEKLGTLYKDPQVSTKKKMEALLEFLGSQASCLQEMPAGCRRSQGVIVLLDNFEDVLNPETRGISDSELDEALKAILTLPQHPVNVIITTRVPPKDLMLIQPERQTFLPLDEGLESPYAENILREMDADGRVGLKDTPDEGLKKAKEATRGYPRALEALFAILAADRDTTLDDMLIGTEQLLPENVVQVLVGEAFNRLDATAQQVMQALAIYNRPVSATAVDYLLESYLPGVDSAPVLSRLVNMHFVRKEGKQYYLHPVDRTYALARIPAYTQPTLFHRGADYFKQIRKSKEEWKTLDDLIPQLVEIDLRCAAGDYDCAAEVLLEIGFHYLLLWGHYRLMIELHKRLQGKISSSNLKQNCAGNLGSAYYSTGQVQKAIDYYEQALIMAREAGDKQGEGVCLGNLGLAYSDLGQITRAIEHYDQALAIDREVGYRKGEGIRLGNLGNAYAALGQSARSIEYYDKALTIAREIGDRRNEGNWLGNLGNRYAELGQPVRAIEYYEQALAIAREIGDRRGQGNRLGNLGSRYAELGQSARAIEYFEQALAIVRETGDRRAESVIIENMGHVLLAQDDFANAIQSYKQAIQIADEIHSPSVQHNARWELALAYLYTNNFSAARTVAEAARQYDMPENNHNVLTLLGVIALRQGDVPAAQEVFSTAISHADSLLEKTSQLYGALDAKGVALCGLALCRGENVNVQQNCVSRAIEAFQAARQITNAKGIVGRVLRLFDALAVADKEGILTNVRAIMAGKQSGNNY